MELDLNEVPVVREEEVITTEKQQTQESSIQQSTLQSQAASKQPDTATDKAPADMTAAGEQKKEMSEREAPDGMDDPEEDR